MGKVVPALLIAGTRSGVGKTTVVAGIVGALARRGLAVQPFKVGPDYIDPSYHSRLAGRPCRNLDSWMVSPARLAELYRRATADADIAVVEGVMGLFDGHPDRAAGSSAELAKMLGLPVVLVMSVAAMGQSAGAVAYGYSMLDTDLNVAGVIANRASSPGHLRLVAEAIDAATGLPVVGHMPSREDLELPERHLGLVPEGERRASDEFVNQLLAQVEETIDLDALLRLARHAGPTNLENHAARSAGEGDSLFPAEVWAKSTTIAVARDEAFCFYYEDNLDLLSAWGAKLAPFSPLHDAGLPPEARGVYLGGGFPEVYAADLAANTPMLDALRAAAARGTPIYAECGGLMYLCRTLGDLRGARHEVVGLVPANASIHGGRLALGYAEVRARHDTVVLRRGQVARGHEFHYSTLDTALDGPEAAYDLPAVDARSGYRDGNLLASYVHLHFASNPRIAPNFVAACTAWGGKL